MAKVIAGNRVSLLSGGITFCFVISFIYKSNVIVRLERREVIWFVLFVCRKYTSYFVYEFGHLMS